MIGIVNNEKYRGDVIYYIIKFDFIAENLF